MPTLPGLDRPVILVAALLYLVLVSVIGLWAARRTVDTRDFFIAGQRLGLVATGLGTMSAAFSGFVFLGGPGLTYRLGVDSLWIVLPLGFTATLLCRVVGVPLWRMARSGNVLTVVDVVQQRYGSRGTSGLAAVAVALGSVAYLASQLLAAGLLLQAVLGWSLTPALLLGAAVVLAYSAAGGMLAGAYTDVAQGVIMLVAAVAVFVHALVATGGWTAMLETLAAAPEFGPEFVQPFGGLGVPAAMGFFFVFGIGVLGQPHMLHRFFMLRDGRSLRWLPLVLGGSQGVCVLIWIGIGLAVPALVARGELEPLARPDMAAPLFLLNYTPRLVAGITVAGVLAAIMSTSDSFLNIGAATLVRDLPRALGRPAAGDLRSGRLAVLGVAVTATILALSYRDLIALLGTFAFGTFAAALAPAMAVGLNWSRVGARAAGASIATGLVSNLLLEWTDATPLPSAVALAASFSVLLAVSWLCAPPPRCPPAGRGSSAP